MEINLDFSWWPLIKGIILGSVFWFIFLIGVFKKTKKSVSFFENIAWILFFLTIAAAVMLIVYIFETRVSGSFFVTFWGMTAIPFIAKGIYAFLNRNKKNRGTISLDDLDDSYDLGYLFSIILGAAMLLFSILFIVTDCIAYKSSGKIVVCEVMQKTKVVAVDGKNYILFMEKDRAMLKPIENSTANAIKKDRKVFDKYYEKGMENPVLVRKTKNAICKEIVNVARNEKIPSLYISLEEAQKLFK